MKTAERSVKAGPSTGTLVEKFAALGESKRLGILATLARGGQCACDLSGCCDDRQPLLSFHLKRLRETGLVSATREGRRVRYELDRDAVRELGDALHALADGETAAPGCC